MVKRRGAQWVPNYHGAWAMVAIPPLLGAFESGFVWPHVVLLALWWLGYFDFFAIGLWLRSGRKARFWPPVVAYTVPCVVLGVVLALWVPFLLVWVAVFAPLVGITFWQSAVRADRSMLNDTVTVAAASLMLPVAAHVGHVSGWSRVWIVTILVFAYFLGTVFYVKTNIRKRSSSVWLGLSVAWHVCGLIFACVCCGFDAGASVSFWHCVVWGLLVVRAVAVPLWGARHGWMSAKALGVGEIVASLLVTLTLVIR